MIKFVEEKQLKNLEFGREDFYLCLASSSEELLEQNWFAIGEKFPWRLKKSGISRFESHVGLDYITLVIPDLSSVQHKKGGRQVHIFFTGRLLVFLCKKKSREYRIVESFRKIDRNDGTLGKFLCMFFDRLMEKDEFTLDHLEQQIGKIEEDLITSKRSDCVKEIVQLRNRLLYLKRYYEQMYHILDCIQENENSLLDRSMLRYIKMAKNRADRLLQTVISLRDYVSQVREAYQAQVDINLNNVMKIFTVITTIFSPLALIAGWYGMNLQMPEYTWAWGYPAVILLSISVVVICLWLFKKHRWFS